MSASPEKLSTGKIESIKDFTYLNIEWDDEKYRGIEWKLGFYPERFRKIKDLDLNAEDLKFKIELAMKSIGYEIK